MKYLLLDFSSKPDSLPDFCPGKIAVRQGEDHSGADLEQTFLEKEIPDFKLTDHRSLRETASHGGTCKSSHKKGHGKDKKGGRRCMAGGGGKKDGGDDDELNEFCAAIERKKQEKFAKQCRETALKERCKKDAQRRRCKELALAEECRKYNFAKNCLKCIKLARGEKEEEKDENEKNENEDKGKI